MLIEEGALPPTFIIASAIADLEYGRAVLWYSLFLFVQGVTPHAIGSGGFKGEHTKGRVEIGYGVAEAHRNKGIASAAVRLLVQRAFAEGEVSEVFAETSVQNIASRRVVEKAGFQCIGQRQSESDGLVDQWLLQQ